MYRNLLLPAGFLASTIVGAGMFALPYVTAAAGLAVGVGYLILFSVVSALMHLLYADVIVRTPENHRFVGYAELYLGKIGKGIAVVATIVGILFSLMIYLVLASSFLKVFISGPDLMLALGFWLLASIPIFFNINRLVASENIIMAGMIGIILLIFFYGAPGVSRVVMSPLANPSLIFLPYGAILFSLAGRTAVPALLGYFRNNGKPVKAAKAAIILGSMVPAALYLLFILSILAISPSVSEDSITGVREALPSWVVSLLTVLGLIAIWSTYIVIGRDVKKSLFYDFKFPDFFAGAAVVAVPLGLYLLGLRELVPLISVAGGVFIGLEGIFVLLMWRQASQVPASAPLISRFPAAVLYILLLVFGLGIVYEIGKLVG